ncbi:MAG: hypothetical protein AB7S26_32175 [Sandaracinaceae bacterium]
MLPEEDEKTDPSMSLPLDASGGRKVARTIPLDMPVPDTVALPAEFHSTDSQQIGEPSPPSHVVKKPSIPAAAHKEEQDLSIGAVVGLFALVLVVCAAIAFTAVWAIVA